METPRGTPRLVNEYITRIQADISGVCPYIFLGKKYFFVSTLGDVRGLESGSTATAFVHSAFRVECWQPIKCPIHSTHLFQVAC